MTNASLLIVPDRFKASKLYSQLPQDGSGDFVVTRATTAYRTNENGILESVASGVPRLDFPIGSGCPALLVEPAATNLLLRSEEFDDIYWLKTGSTISANATPAPNGATTADKLVENALVGEHGVARIAGMAASGTYTLSVFAKAAERTRVAIGNSSSGHYAIFDLSLGTVVQASQGTVTNGTISGILANGFYRVSCTITVASAASTSITLVSSGTTISYLGNGTNGIFLWGAQLETGSVATSYIPTVAAAATRNADVINKTAVSGLIGQTEGVVYAEVDVRNFAAAGIFLSISDATSSNRVQLYKFTDSKIYADRISATQSALTSISTSALSIGIYKVAFAYSSGNSALFINGVQIGSTALQTFTFGAMGKINIGSRFDDTQIINDRIRAAALYTTRLSNAQLQSLTTL
jgi:hypothetical protein